MKSNMEYNKNNNKIFLTFDLPRSNSIVTDLLVLTLSLIFIMILYDTSCTNNCVLSLNPQNLSFDKLKLLIYFWIDRGKIFVNILVTYFWSDFNLISTYVYSLDCLELNFFPFWLFIAYLNDFLIFSGCLLNQKCVLIITIINKFNLRIFKYLNLFFNLFFEVFESIAWLYHLRISLAFSMGLEVYFSIYY